MVVVKMIVRNLSSLTLDSSFLGNSCPLENSGLSSASTTPKSI